MFSWLGSADGEDAYVCLCVLIFRDLHGNLQRRKGPNVGPKDGARKKLTARNQRLEIWASLMPETNYNTGFSNDF